MYLSGRKNLGSLHGSPIGVGSLEEIIDDDYAYGPAYYVSILSFAMFVVGVLQNDTDPTVSVMKLERAPTDIGGLEQQIQGIKES
ncbi:14194_t:CDS:2, partial [Cetraspora pellucida]